MLRPMYYDEFLQIYDLEDDDFAYQAYMARGFEIFAMVFEFLEGHGADMTKEGIKRHRLKKANIFGVVAGGLGQADSLQDS